MQLAVDCCTFNIMTTVFINIVSISRTHPVPCRGFSTPGIQARWDKSVPANAPSGKHAGPR